MATQLTASASTIVHDESITVPFFRLIGTYEQIYVVHGRFLPSCHMRRRVRLPNQHFRNIMMSGLWASEQWSIP